MRYLKKLGLAAVAAMILMATGASTASATKLCEENQESGCTKDVASGTNLKFVAEGTTTLTGPFGEVVDKCEGSTMEGPTSNTGSASETVIVKITKIDYIICIHPITIVSTLGTIELHKIAGKRRGTVTSTDTTTTVHETLFGTCTFLTNNTDIGEIVGKDDPGNATPGTPTFVVKGKLPSENCGFSATWEGSYKYEGTTPFNVSES